MTIYLQKVTLPSTDWEIFLDISVEYITKNWPRVLKGKTNKDFKKDYEKELVERIKEGDRALFLIQDDSSSIGIANVYLKDNILNIAEFFIYDDSRRKGFGSKAVALLIKWEKSKKATSLRVEVDKDLTLANLFWSSLGLKLDTSKKRNIYFSEIL
ncbi:MAG: hypothetical protein K940chlam4_01136 [Candidatus Anoxychlamydiales bacterium]|nr:hypothetical protein [Candidatus Anoxychlamydiales bacterium]